MQSKHGLELLETRLEAIEQATTVQKPSYILTIVHERNVAKYAKKIALELGLNQERGEIELAARFHDIGKITWPEELYTREMSKEEKLLYKETHNIKGFNIVKSVSLEIGITDGKLRTILDGIKFHHERYDGDVKCKYKAYPGERDDGKIPLCARIITVVDHFDAMISNRPYRKKDYTKEEALEDLVLKKEIEYDPEIVDVFVSIVQKEMS